MIFKLIFFYILFNKILLNPSCESYLNHCLTCNPKTNLCKRCEKPDILIPDEKGGCIGSKKCILGKNYCLECESDGKICNLCDSGYFPDENGGCSYSNFCKISFKGECIECIDNYILVGKQFELKICKSILSNDFLNCKEINKEKGFCEECEEGYFLNNGDRKCIKTEKCNESIFGNCILCNRGYYFDKKENKCKKQENNFLHCKQTIDGNTCDICEDEFYFDQNKNCTFTNFCSVSSNSICQKCIEGYYLASNSLCSDTQNCYRADNENGLCLECNNNYYLDSKDYKCKSNSENPNFKFCKKVENDFCINCELYYNLDEEGKCCNTSNCSSSKDGICILCSENYYLGMDKYCSNIEHCIYTKMANCIECEENYYYSKSKKKCLNITEKFFGCKISNEDGYYCEECKNNYYLRKNDSLCFKNTNINDKFYKCIFTDYKGEYCIKCDEGYYLGGEDKKCSLIKNCAISNNENICIKCNKGYCLDEKNNICIDNTKIENINIKTFFACEKTNKEGTACEKCIEGYEVNEEGFCYNIDNCLQKEDKICIKCKPGTYVNDYCLNNVFGCIKNNLKNCFKCDNIFDFNICTECKEGYIKTVDGKCENQNN